MKPNLIKTQGILKNLNSVLKSAKMRFLNEYQEQEVELNDNFKIEYRNFLRSKKWDVEFYDCTSVVITNGDNKIYIANQWFVLASFFVDFCSEMNSYRDIYISICRDMGYNTLEAIKEYSTKIRATPTELDKISFLSAAKVHLTHNYSTIDDDYDRVANYLWRFASDYKWWAGNKTIDRHDFYISPLLNQMNVVNANSEFLAIICMAFASNLKLRILVNDIHNFTVNYIPNTIQSHENPTSSSQDQFEPIVVTTTEHEGISISAASLQRFKQFD